MGRPKTTTRRNDHPEANGSAFRDCPVANRGWVREQRIKAAALDLYEAAKNLLDRADAVIFRPSVDDSRRMDQDARALRAALEPARAAIAKADGK